MALTLIVLMLTLLAVLVLVVSALAFWRVEPGPKGR